MNFEVKTTEMEDSVENLFHSMVDQDNFSEAIDFVAGCYYQVPQYSVIRSIIFNILWKNCDDKVALEAKSYLLNVLKIYAPVNTQSREYYLNALQGYRGVLSELWVVFSNLINSCFQHYRVDTKTATDYAIPLVKFPNCNFLLDYCVQLFVTDYDCFSSERDVYVQDKKCLVMHLLGSTSTVSANNGHFRQILRWINDIYKNKAFAMRDVSQLLHDMLCLIVKCIIQWKSNTSDTEAFNNSFLSDVVKDIVTFCKDAFTSPDNLRIFVTSVPLKFLQAKICEQKLIEIVYHTNRPQASVLTLKKIVDLFMFPYDKASKKTKVALEKASSTDRLSKKKFTVKQSVKGNTKLHEACKNNKPGDLMALIRSCGKEVNAKNDAHRTALHEACLAGSFFCANILIRETGKGDIPAVDISAPDIEGLSPLHYAVAVNSISIANCLLAQGGSRLLNAVDKKGRKPNSFIKSQEMRDVIESFAATSAGKNIKHEVPNFNNYKNYAIYLLALNFLLSFYSHIFNLSKFVFSKKHKVVVKSHENKECEHFVSTHEAVVCEEDSDFIEGMPDVIDTFMESVKMQTKEKEFNIDLELLAFKMYAATLVE